MLAYKAWEVSPRSFQLLATLASASIKRDKKLFLDDLTAKADQSAARGDNKMVYKLAQSAAGIKTEELNVVKWEDGSLTTSEEQYTQRFQDHFCEVFDAEIVESLQAIRVQQRQEPFDRQGPRPTASRVERAIAKLRDCAIRPDAISAVLLKAGGAPCAVKLWELIDKI